MTTWKVPLADVTLGPEEIAAVTEVLQSGWLSMGPKTQEFEAAFRPTSWASNTPSRWPTAPPPCIWPVRCWD